MIAKIQRKENKNTKNNVGFRSILFNSLDCPFVQSWVIALSGIGGRVLERSKLFWGMTSSCVLKVYRVVLSATLIYVTLWCKSIYIYWQRREQLTKWKRKIQWRPAASATKKRMHSTSGPSTGGDCGVVDEWSETKEKRSSVSRTLNFSSHFYCSFVYVLLRSLIFFACYRWFLHVSGSSLEESTFSFPLCDSSSPWTRSGDYSVVLVSSSLAKALYFGPTRPSSRQTYVYAYNPVYTQTIITKD